MATIAAIGARIQKLKPVRVFQHYAVNRGPLLAGGLAYQAIFAVFAALWVGFSVAGLLLESNPRLQDAFFSFVSASVPGLIDTGSGEGAIEPDDLLQAEILGWTGALAAVGVIVTALNFLASCRDAVRVMFDLPGELLNFFLLKLKDLGLAIAFGVALIVSAALSVLSTQALDGTLDFLGLDSESLMSALGARVTGLALMYLLDVAVLAGLYRALSGLRIPFRRLIGGSLLGAAALGILKVLGNALLGGATNNPLLASFAVIIGLLIWFNLICQVLLAAAAWIAMGMADANLIADPKVHAAKLEADRVEAEKIAEARAAAETQGAVAPGAAKKHRWKRIFRRR
ncbi:MAG: YihY/virulence factor BrkB family protein [Mycetocola sp.]|nr:YihY/virulence factor BrkB family protein [Mycetocola sp.]